MLEWLNGYWTAMRHVANAAPQPEQGPSLIEWLSGLGSAGAALSAAVAAFLSWRVARESRRSRVETERASIFLTLAELFNKTSNGLCQAHEAAHEIELEYRHLNYFGHEWEKIVAELKDLGNEYADLVERIGFHDELAKARSIEELQLIRLRFATIYSGIGHLEHRQRLILHRGHLIRKAMAIKAQRAQKK